MIHSKKRYKIPLDDREAPKIYKLLLVSQYLKKGKPSALKPLPQQGPGKDQIDCRSIIASLALHFQEADSMTETIELLITWQQLLPLCQGFTGYITVISFKNCMSLFRRKLLKKE